MRIWAGMVRLARFDASGFAAFRNTAPAVLSSLAPLLAFPIVGGLSGIAGGQGLSALIDFLATIVALLAPLIISHAFARHWDRLAQWPRFAASTNWCQWVLPLLAVVVALVVMMLGSAGLPMRQLVMTALVLFVGYGVSLHWFIARHGLGISRLRAVVLVLVSDLGTGALVMVPRLLAGDAS